jgi:hypothetical protein
MGKGPLRGPYFSVALNGQYGYLKRIPSSLSVPSIITVNAFTVEA